MRKERIAKSLHAALPLAAASHTIAPRKTFARVDNFRARLPH
ncbi:MAG: hypothetical protein WCD76_12555 [Pyrinomonadaceae bacterium]